MNPQWFAGTRFFAQFIFPTVFSYFSYLNSLVKWIAYSSYLNSLLRFHTKKRKRCRIRMGRKYTFSLFVLRSYLWSTQLIKLWPFFRGKFMKNRQNIILWYKNVIRKVHKLSFDTFLKTIGAEMNAPGLSKSRPYLFLY